MPLQIYRFLALGTSFLVGASTSLAADVSALGMLAPAVFAPGVISGPSNDGAPTFSPDGQTLLFERSYAHFTAIFESHRTQKGNWSTPSLATFSGPSADQQPSFSPDGRYVVYASIRPLPGGTQTQTQSRIFRVDRTANGWSEPVELPYDTKAMIGVLTMEKLK